MIGYIGHSCGFYSEGSKDMCKPKLTVEKISPFWAARSSGEAASIIRSLCSDPWKIWAENVILPYTPCKALYVASHGAWPPKSSPLLARLWLSVPLFFFSPLMFSYAWCFTCAVQHGRWWCSWCSSDVTSPCEGVEVTCGQRWFQFGDAPRGHHIVPAYLLFVLWSFDGSWLYILC